VADTDDDVPLTCDECGREPRPDENADDEWQHLLRASVRRDSVP
jgi:hypothetical protein